MLLRLSLSFLSPWEFMTRLNWLRNLSPIDGAAAVIACLALVGVVWSPKLNQAIAKASGSMQSVGVSVDVRHLQLAQPELLLQSIRDEGSVNIVIRNQPAGRWVLVRAACLLPARSAYARARKASASSCTANVSRRG